MPRACVAARCPGARVYSHSMWLLPAAVLPPQALEPPRYATFRDGENFVLQIDLPECTSAKEIECRPYEEGGSDAGIAEQIELIIFEARNERRRV